MDASKSIFPQFHYFSKNQSSTNSMVAFSGLICVLQWSIQYCVAIKHLALGYTICCFLDEVGLFPSISTTKNPHSTHHTAVKGIFLKFRHNHFIPCSWSEAHKSLNEPARLSVTWFLLNSPAAFHTKPLTPYAAATLASQFLKASCFTDPCICNSFYLEWCPHPMIMTYLLFKPQLKC